MAQSASPTAPASGVEMGRIAACEAFISAGADAVINTMAELPALLTQLA